MGIGFTGGRGGIVSEVNVVPLIDILLVLLVIFMIIPHRQVGLEANLPHETSTPDREPPPETIVVQMLSDGSLRINQSAVRLDDLRDRLDGLFARRANRVAFLQASSSLEFQVVAQVLEVMHASGASPVGLLTSELEKNR